MILDEILAHKAGVVAARRSAEPEAAVAARAATAPPPRDFRAALAGPDLALVAEVKRASPSTGPLRPDLDAPALARRYADAGAAAVSVLTDERFFGGSDDDLVAVRHGIPLPVLRKDFVIDPYQVYEARALGADAVLLIVGALAPASLRDLAALADALGMAALVEIHTAAELATALEIGATLIGINNRDLTTMTVDLETTARLRPLVPPGVTVVSESGVKSAEDVRRLRDLGVDAVLVGSSLVAAGDPARLVRELVEAGRPTTDDGRRTQRRVVSGRPSSVVRRPRPEAVS